jgi:5-(carboxyamino)imidazole ribonucleotide synthase
MLLSKYHKDKPFTIGILGGGQLAKMLAQEAYKMGINVAIIDKSEGTPAGDMTKHEFSGGWENKDELMKFLEVADAVTLENEFIDPDILALVESKRMLYPSSATMRLIQDKFIQKTTFKEAGIPVPNFEKIDSLQDLYDFGEKYGYPFVAKARKYGYDGYGNATIFKKEDATHTWNKFNENTPRPLYAEQFVDFRMELAVMAARNKNEEWAIYPTVETVQYRHICHSVTAPAEINEELQTKAQNIAKECISSINGIGIFGVEFFLTKNNEILVNEIAPRPHNTGHYTIEACYTSQFENALRAVLGLPLGSPKMRTNAAAMVNLLGERGGVGVPEDVTEMLRHKHATLHLYNKKESRNGRKMGHITALGSNTEEAKCRAKSAAEAIKW